MLVKIEIKHRWLGRVLFLYEKEGNTIKDTLEEAVKQGANLCRADLSGADLCGANLCGADLHKADLCGADLSGADLCGADLCGADLSGADLHKANLCRANLCRANLCGANLCRANLCGANLCGADLSDDTQIPYYPLACPSDGAFIGWKKALFNYSAVLVKLEIPADARRTSATGLMCRCDKAKVLRITNLLENIDYKSAWSQFTPDFTYEVGKEVSVPDFDENRWHECAPGIHFFINKQEAINY